MDYTDLNGKRHRESTKTNNRDEAKRIIKDRESRIARGEVLLPRVDRITYDEARDDLVAYYEAHGTRNLAEARARLAHLDTFFTGRKLVQIGQGEGTAYAKDRLAMEAPRRL
jgi:hypothetical protein